MILLLALLLACTPVDTADTSTTEQAPTVEVYACTERAEVPWRDGYPLVLGCNTQCGPVTNWYYAPEYGHFLIIPCASYTTVEVRWME